MNNYLKKYSNYFLGLGGLLLLMYFLDVVPYRFRNAPESLRLFFPIILIIVGFIGKFLDNNNSNFHQSFQNINDQLNYQNSTVFEKDIIKETHSGFSNHESNREIKNMSPNDWFKQNPGKSLNDYYAWKLKNIAKKDTPIESDSKDQQYFNKNQNTNRNPNINENLVKDEFRIDKKGLTYLYKKEDIENFIKEGKISARTKIRKLDWFEWKCVKDTEFNYLLKSNVNWKPYIIGVIIVFLVYVVYDFSKNNIVFASFFDSCGCESKWKDSIANSPLYVVDFWNEKTEKNYAPFKKNWENSEVEEFINSIGGEQYYLPYGSVRAFELFINNDVLMFYEDGDAYSFDQGHTFKWVYEKDKIKIYDSIEGTSIKLFTGEIISKNGKAFFIESDENKRERGILVDELPARINDLCACQCNFRERMEELDNEGVSELKLDQMMNSECNYILESEEYFTPWGDIKQILTRK